MRVLSIQSRLLILTLSAVLVVGAVTGWLGYRRAVHEVDELLDAQLAQYARLMLALAHETGNDEVALPAYAGHDYENRILFQIWDREHGRYRLLQRSHEAPVIWPQGVAERGYSEARIGDRHWRCLAVQDAEGERAVLAAFDLHFRNELARQIALGNLSPYLLGLPVLAVLLILGIRGGLAPLRGLEQELGRRSPDQLDPLEDTHAPRELRPPLRAMNALFGRMARALENERRFTSDAAHELRTPLAALQAQLQVAERTPDEAERAGAIAKARKGVVRMTHLVTQLLSLARLEGQGAGGLDGRCDLSALVAETAGELYPSAQEKGVRLEVEAQEGVMVAGKPDLLRILLRNLLDNAIRYGGAGGGVVVELQGERVLTVSDDGPGVAEADLEKLGLRFHRFGRQGVEGVGLGLSIVRRIAELHGAELTFGPGIGGQGLGIRLRFPG